MSFETQETRGSCGTAALLYALSILGYGHTAGRELTESVLRQVVGKSRLAQQRKGTSDKELAVAARRLGLEMSVHSYAKCVPEQCLVDLQAATDRGHPCIVSWHDDHENFFHWVCVAGFDGPDVIVLDPALLDHDLPGILFDPVDPGGENVPARMSVRRFKEWITPGSPFEEGEEAHYFIELWPAVDHEERFVPGRWTGNLLRAMVEDPDLFCHFDEYIDDLRSIFEVPRVKDDSRSAYAFLAEHQEWLLRLADQWTLEPDQLIFFVQEIKTLLAITKDYPFTVEAGDEDKVLDRLVFYLAWMGCESTYEVGRYE